MPRQSVVALAAAVVLVASVGAQQARVASTIAEYTPGSVVLLPTIHPRVPRDLTQLWFVPEKPNPVSVDFASAARLQAKGDYLKALPLLSNASSQPGIFALYASYDMGVALLNLGRADEARRIFEMIGERKPVGYLGDAAAFGLARSAEALNDSAAAVAIYTRLLQGKAGRTDELLMRLGTAAQAAGQPDRAVEAFMRLYYEFPLSEFAPSASVALARLPNAPDISQGSERYGLEMARADRLFSAKQYAPARTAFTALKSMARGDDRELADLRIAESNYFLKRPREARDGLRPYLTSSTRKAEVLYFSALSMRALGATPDYLTTIRRIADDFPQERWAEDALNSLATHYIVHDDDEKADEILRELYRKYPKSSHAERAAWKIGWRAFLQEQYGDTATFFERAASDFPRSDYRPSWLYWAGRAHELRNERDLATDRFTLVAADYLNSYYGRLAVKRLGGWLPAPRVIADNTASGGSLPSPALENAVLIRSLVAGGLYGHALGELRHAQRTAGDSPAIQATIAWISHQQGLTETGQSRFTLLRGAITTMRRAYPQFLAAGGEQLPREILTVIFPLEYWDLIEKYSIEERLDPYLVAALVAQESTFAPEVRSVANAYGLMQLLPSTARQQARKLRITYSTRLLTNPEANIHLGTSYFAEKMHEFGSAHLALASYNAGEAAVRRWTAERPTLGNEEFIDDIPYPETQNYVKRILGTAEDYRRLYGP